MASELQPAPEDVFIAGGLPSETYVTRSSQGFDATLRRWQRGRQKPLLSVSGATKTGKTVLLRRTFPDALFLSGGSISDTDEFWEALADKLEAFTNRSLQAGTSGTLEHGGSATLDAGVAKAEGSRGTASTSTRGFSESRAISSKIAARNNILQKGTPLVIDDFHYIPSNEQLYIVRGLKDLIFDGLSVVVAAVPHRAYDIVRVEKEMTGRVQALDISSWDKDDLRAIATQGFEALGVDLDDSDTIERLIEESFRSPHLMQSHCLALCHYNEDQNGGDLPSRLSAPRDWQSFFQNQASLTSKTAFDLLKRGRRQRKDRQVRTLSNGTRTDIYGAVLAALEQVGSEVDIPYEVIRNSLRQILPAMPQRHEITNILRQMTRIAKDEIGGEPVLEYDEELSTLYIADPFFAYYLRWAPPDLKSIEVSTSLGD